MRSILFGFILFITVAAFAIVVGGVAIHSHTGGGQGGLCCFNQQLTNTLVADVSITDTTNFFDGPSVAQGSTGTWYACASADLQNSSAGLDTWFFKLWDGTSIMASGAIGNGAAGSHIILSTCGLISNPTGNIRLSVKNTTSAAGPPLIRFNASGESKDATLTAYRLR